MIDEKESEGGLSPSNFFSAFAPDEDDASCLFFSRRRSAAATVVQFWRIGPTRSFLRLVSPGADDRLAGSNSDFFFFFSGAKPRPPTVVRFRASRSRVFGKSFRARRVVVRSCRRPYVFARSLAVDVSIHV